MPMPVFPLELEREIIILAIDCMQQAYSLLFVSQRVRYWIESLLYRKIVLSNENIAISFLSSLRIRCQRSGDFARGIVKSLCIEGDVLLSTAAEILSLCSGATNLALWIAPSDFNGTTNPLLQPLNNLPLMSLSLSISLIFRYTKFVSLGAFKAFSTVTHLEILNGWVLWNSTIGLEYLDGLTHLCLHIHTQRTKPDLVVSLLARSHLQVLVFRISEDINAVQTFLEFNSLSDSRIVLVSQVPTAWGEFGGGDMSLWKDADQVVDWRRTSTQGGPFGVPSSDIIHF
ncbi:uncharacterized protein F5891DRAFT_1180740 [Suillus fuscotomentosus]|uniref:Uncharacterized protein n=1 Tax=Suillus fuscotomentosus TaxID=1912939 RepID=A0AAD4EKC9_9AGAM|nr:uncharacterized protein F5891DRAFT_1180740 [Suillus fuscotomentosus]KAG1907712.1 hypothetical protein F5891DRAFT_1180740 [Suillus fuscotomentosus]